MKILFTQTYYLPYISGLTIYARRLTQGLAHQGHRVTLLAHRHQKNLPRCQQQNGVTVRRVDYWRRFHKGFLSPLWPWHCWQQVRRHQAVICNLPQIEAFWPVLWGKILNKKTVVIYTCRVVLPPGLVNWLIEKGLRLVHWLTCLLADNVVVYTADYARAVKNLSAFRDKTKAILPPVTVAEEDKKATTKLAKQVSIDKTDLVVGFVARISAEKGLEHLIKAIGLLRSRYESLQLLVAGPKKEVVGEEDYFNKIKELVKQYPEVSFLGTLAEKEMSSFYRLVDVLVLPSINNTEAFGLVQVEAMLNGTPVVASDLPGVRMPVRLTGMGEIIPVGDSAAIAAAIEKIKSQPKDYVQPIVKIAKTFSPKETISEFEQLLKG